jgi:hypothetical protein
MEWQKKAPAAGSDWIPITGVQSRDVFGDLAIGNLTMADNGTRYRPAFLTANSIFHYGREATLTVKPLPGSNGVFYSTALHGLRYYLNGIDQNLSTGLHTIDGKRYFARNGSIQLGFVTDPLVPGGRAHFTLEKGMTTNDFVLEDGRALRYFDGTGAMRTTPGDVVLNNKTYSFDAGGNAVQPIAEKTVKKDSGPGALRVRIVQVPGRYTTVDFAATSTGSLGGGATDRVRVTVGSRSASFGMNQKAEDVARVLNERFRGFGGQPSIGEAHLTITLNGTQLIDQSNTLSCPAPTGVTSRGVPLNCFAQPTVTLPDVADYVDDVVYTAAHDLRTMTPAAVGAALGAPADDVRANMRAFAFNPGYITNDLDHLTHHFAPLNQLLATAETTLVRPVLTRVHAGIRQAFREELGVAIGQFNIHDVNRLLVQATEIESGLDQAEAEIATDIPEAVRDLARGAVAAYVGADFEDYQDAIDDEYLRQIGVLGMNDPGLRPLLDLNLQFLDAGAYLQAEEQTTLEAIDVYRQMVLILRTTPAQANGTPTTFSYATLEAQARQALGLPPAVG